MPHTDRERLAGALRGVFQLGFPGGQSKWVNPRVVRLWHVGVRRQFSVYVKLTADGTTKVRVPQFELLSRHLVWSGRGAGLCLEGGTEFLGGRLGRAGLYFEFDRGDEAAAMALVKGIASTASKSFRGEFLATKISKRVLAFDPGARVRLHGSGVNVRFDSGGVADVYVYSDGDAEVFFGAEGEFEQFLAHNRDGRRVIILPDGQRHLCEQLLDPCEREACFVCHFPLGVGEAPLLDFIDGIGQICEPYL